MLNFQFPFRAAAWSKYHIAVSQRKEEEDTSQKDYYDSHSPGVRLSDLAISAKIPEKEILYSLASQHSPAPIWGSTLKA